MHRIRHVTHDREASPVLTSERIGPKRFRTPEGYLYCEDVPFARVGQMLYHEDELVDERGDRLIEGGPDGVVRIERDAKALFDPQTLASYNGKPVINEHPEGVNIGPRNIRSLPIIGTILNPRRGEGDDSDVALCDLLITDAEGIEDIESDKREVSAGYEAEYEQLARGRGRQFNIIGNHIALVERGRCGPRCAIGDHQPKEQAMPAATTTKQKRRAIIQDRVRAAFKDMEESIVGALDDPGSDDGDDAPGNGDVHVHVHAPAAGGSDPGAPKGAMVPGGDGDDGAVTPERFAALEQSVAALAEAIKKLGGGEAPAGGAPPAAAAGGEDEPGEQDAMPEELEAARKAKVGDSAALQTAFQSVVADAEVLVPGFRVPTFDAKASRKLTLDTMCQLRRSTLGHLRMTGDGAAMLDALASSLDPQKAPCVDVARAFRAVAGARKLMNNSAATRDAGTIAQPLGQKAVGGMTLAQLNELNSKAWAPVLATQSVKH